MTSLMKEMHSYKTIVEWIVIGWRMAPPRSLSFPIWYSRWL